jgi:hypothetical protein
VSRHRFDHAQALDVYLALEPPNRTYAAVAREVGCSEQSVRRWARSLKWAEKLRAADERAMARSLKTREQRVADVLKLTDGLVDHFLVNQAPKAEAATFLDVERMVKLSELLVGEATDRVSLSEAQSFLQLVFAAALDWAGRDVPAAARRAGLKGAIDELVAGIATEGGETA